MRVKEMVPLFSHLTFQNNNMAKKVKNHSFLALIYMLRYDCRAFPRLLLKLQFIQF